MDVARIIRHGIKHCLALAALMTAGVIMLQAVKPDVSARLLGTQYSPGTSPSIAMRLIEGMLGGGKEVGRPASGTGPRFDPSVLFSGPARRGVATSGSGGGQSGSSLLALVARNGVTAISPSSGHGGFLTFNDLAPAPVSPVAVRTRLEAAPRASGPSATPTRDAAYQPPVREAEPQASAHPSGFRRAPDADATPFAARPTPVTAPSRPPEAGAAQTATPGREAGPDRGRTMADDLAVAQTLIAKARLDIRIFPYAGAAVGAFSRQYSGSRASNALKRSLADLHTQLKDELRQRRGAEKGALLAPVEFSPQARTLMSRCLGEMSGLVSLYAARRLVQPFSPIPAYLVVTEGALSKQGQSSLRTCLRPMFNAGTVAIFSSQSKEDAYTVHAIRTLEETKLYTRGLLAGSTPGKQ